MPSVPVPPVILLTDMVTRCRLLAAHGLLSCLSVRTQPLTATGAPSHRPLPYLCHTLPYVTGRPGAPGDSGSWSSCNGTVEGNTLTGTFDYANHGQPVDKHGWNDTGTVEPNAAGGLPTLSWQVAGSWAPGGAVNPPQPSPAPTHGFAVSVIDRNLGPPGGGAVVSKANGTSSFEYNFNAAYFPVSPQGQDGRDGLAIRVLDGKSRKKIVSYYVAPPNIHSHTYPCCTHLIGSTRCYPHHHQHVSRPRAHPCHFLLHWMGLPDHRSDNVTLF